jgi:DNA polymerase-3 subunit delta
MPGRTYDDLRRSLAKGDIQPVYYLHGDEDFLKDDAVRQILALAVDEATRDFNLDRRRAPELAAEDFRSLVGTPPMMAARRGVVLTEIECLQQRRPRQQALKAAVVGYLKRPSQDTVLVLVQTAGEKPDPDLEAGPYAVDVAPLSPERVGRWIQHRAGALGLKIEADAARHLQAAVGEDLQQLSAELSKLAAATGGRGRAATIADVADLVGVRSGETVYDFVDAVTGRRFTAAAEMVPRLVGLPGNSGVRLLNALGTAMVGLALARARLDAREAPAPATSKVLNAMLAARPMGLRPWKEEAARWVRDAAKWTSAELDEGLAALQRADARLKDTRLAGESEVVIEAVLSLGRRGREAA